MKQDHMQYQEGMEAIESEVLDHVLSALASYNPDCVSADMVEEALGKNQLTQRDFGALLSPAATPYLERMAARAKAETGRYFGNGIRLFTPLYLANYCVNHCNYCAFFADNPIRRGHLTFQEIERECAAIAATGLDEILLLTGESRQKSDVIYIGEAVKIAANYFGAVCMEIYPLNVDEYAYLREAGADFVNVYQETYVPECYENVHPKGPKRSYPYRFHAQERALLGGMRGVSFGALLGLGDFRRDCFAAGLHAHFIQKKYPHAEISFSVPRIRAFLSANPEAFSTGGVPERALLQVMLAYRLFAPFAGITISTRERAGFRDNVVSLCATKISAGVLVGVGGHALEAKGDEQFEVADSRSVEEIHRMIRERGLWPVYTDYIAV